MNQPKPLVKHCGLLLLALGTPVSANDFFGTLDTTTQGPVHSDNPFSHVVWVQQKMGYGYRAPALAVSRNSAQLTQLETRLYGRFTWDWDQWQLRLAGSLEHDWLPDLDSAGLWSGYAFNRDQRQARRWRLREDDSYLSWETGDWWIKGGYQTLAWGEAESLKVTDVLARRDQRWPGQADLEQLRLPSPALLINWRRQWELVFLPDTPTDRHAAAQDDFDQLAAFRHPDDYRQPRVRLRSQNTHGWALRWQHTQPGLDLRVLLSDSYSPEPALAELDVDASTPQLNGITLEQARQRMAGINLQTTHGNWVAKTEQAWLEGLRLPAANPLAPWQTKDQWRAMYALEYSGISDLVVSGELTTLYTPDHQPALAGDKWQTGYGLRINYSLFNERLSLGGLGLRLNGNQGDVLRLTANWQHSDRLSLGVTLVEYAATPDQSLYGYRHNDTLLVTLRWGL